MVLLILLFNIENGFCQMKFFLIENYNPVVLQIIHKDSVDVKKLKFSQEIYTKILCYKIYEYESNWLAIDCEEKRDYIFCKDYDYLKVYLIGEEFFKRRISFNFFKTESGTIKVTFINDKEIIENLKKEYKAAPVDIKDSDFYNKYYLLSDSSLLEVTEIVEEPYGNLFESMNQFYLFKSMKMSYEASKFRDFSNKINSYIEFLSSELKLSELEYNRNYSEKIIIKCYEYSKGEDLNKLTLPLIAYLAKFYLNNVPRSKLILQSRKKNSNKEFRPIILFENGEEVDLITSISIRTINKIYDYEYKPYYNFGLFPWDY